MYVVLLTGGLASGKSTAANWLNEWGASLLDLDVLAAEVQEAEFVRQQLEEAFGEDIYTADGALIRSRLAKRAFATPESVEKLNAICWPPVIERVSDYLVGGSCTPLESEATMLVIQIPMLAEAPQFLDLADEVLAIEAPEELRLKRAIGRGMKPEDAEQRMALQASDSDRRALATTIIDNSGSLKQLHEQLYDWYQDRTIGRLF
jgi:dephospho-CoA kinase